LSLASLFAIESGNIDLLIFALMYLGCVTGRKGLKSSLFALAAILKIYPLAGAMVNPVLRPWRERLLPALLPVLVVVILTLQLHDSNLIGHSTPVSTYHSFGTLSIRDPAFSYAARFGLPANQLKHFGYVVVFGCYLIAVLVVVAAAARFKPNRLDGPVRESQQHSEMFAILGAIYAFCFIAGSNWDYRLIFLIPTLPFAFILTRQPEYKYWSMAYIILIIFSENSVDLRMRGGAILAHLASFLTFLFVLTILTQQIMTMGFGGYLRPEAVRPNAK